MLSWPIFLLFLAFVSSIDQIRFKPAIFWQPIMYISDFMYLLVVYSITVVLNLCTLSYCVCHSLQLMLCILEGVQSAFYQQHDNFFDIKGILGLHNFTKKTDIISVMRSVWGQTHEVSTCVNILNALHCSLYVIIVVFEFSSK